ncbi:glycogen/starch/alpha-glucan phosphorylase [Candidatus Saccharibacteria bacterium]|nr:glycogen/starch/alpha-glucan phosphorylase [Candidatus Saccharibacteria bacterium]
MSGQFVDKDGNGIEDVAEFYAAIDRASLTHRISAERPYIYTTMEVYDVENGIRGAGGLGVLAADTRRTAEALEIPFVMLTPFYHEERHQEMIDLVPKDTYEPRNPIDAGFEKVGEVVIKVESEDDATLEIHQKILGSTRFLTMNEPGFGALYVGDASDDHRLYQEVALGLGGYAALKMLGLKPAVIQLNETASTFAAVARLDELCRNGMGLYEAIVYVRKHTLYTNHTLLQAAEPEYTYAQFEKFVFPNLTSPALKHFIAGLFREGRLKLNSLTIEIAEAKNCVSRLHAKVIEVKDLSGERVDFKAITNGIDLNTWLMPEILEFYHDRGILDKFNMPGANFREVLEQIEAVDELRGIKRIGRAKLNEELTRRKNQYGEVVQIPDDAMLFEFKRRFVEYKRPWMPFEDMGEIRSILFESNAHYIMAGMMPGGVDAGDKTYDRLQVMLKNIDNDPFLKERVHYITDYDESLSFAMSAGSDISINVPEVGLEACGTSFMKDIGNLTMLISTNDGGVADVEPPAVFNVHGDSYSEEITSLYEQMRAAAAAMKDDNLWVGQVTKQLAAYLPIICGARMIRDYLRFLFKTEH